MPTDTPSLPKIPTRKSIAAKVRKYRVAAHQRGDHADLVRVDCPLCPQS